MAPKDPHAFLRGSRAIRLALKQVDRYLDILESQVISLIPPEASQRPFPDRYLLRQAHRDIWPLQNIIINHGQRWGVDVIVLDKMSGRTADGASVLEGTHESDDGDPPANHPLSPQEVSAEAASVTEEDVLDIIEGTVEGLPEGGETDDLEIPYTSILPPDTPPAPIKEDAQDIYDGWPDDDPTIDWGSSTQEPDDPMKALTHEETADEEDHHPDGEDMKVMEAFAATNTTILIQGGPVETSILSYIRTDPEGDGIMPLSTTEMAPPSKPVPTTTPIETPEGISFIETPEGTFVGTSDETDEEILTRGRKASVGRQAQVEINEKRKMALEKYRAMRKVGDSEE